MNTPKLIVDNGRPFTLYSGRVVTIFHDPFTRSRPEGVAELVSRISRNHETGSEMWRVKFVHTGAVANRRIHPIPSRQKVA